jgi:hypothetical protein
MSMLSVAMNNFVRNRFKLETQGSQTASPGSIVTVQLPESALIHLPSVRFFFSVATTSETEGSTTVYGRLPADAASALISKVEIFIGGVQIQNGTAEYNTLCRILKIADSSIPRDQSVDKVLSHGAIESADAVESEQLCLHEWRGFLGESVTQYLPTGVEERRFRRWIFSRKRRRRQLWIWRRDYSKNRESVEDTAFTR